MSLTASDGLVNVPGEHVPGPTDDSEFTVERRDGTVDSIASPGANAYAGMVDHFQAVVAGSAEPIFGRTESLRLASILDELHRLSSA